MRSMNSNPNDHLIGITPILIRRAAYYLKLGEGEYQPNHPHYDKVVVSTSYELAQNPDRPEEWSQGALVAFYKDGRRIRWIEFGCRVVGAGGDPILRKVDDSDV